MAIAQHPGVTVTLGGLLDRLVENGDASVEISVPLARGRLLFVPDDDPMQHVVEEVRDEPRYRFSPEGYVRYSGKQSTVNLRRDLVGHFPGRAQIWREGDFVHIRPDANGNRALSSNGGVQRRASIGSFVNGSLPESADVPFTWDGVRVTLDLNAAIDLTGEESKTDPPGQSVTIREAASRLDIGQQSLYDAIARDRTRKIHTPFQRATATGGEPFTAPWHEVGPWLADHRARHPKANLGS
jgi:hypothetical protein